MQELKNKVFMHVFSQIKKDVEALSALEPGLNWNQRVEEALGLFMPRLIEIAPALLREVELILNSPQIIRAIWKKIKTDLQEVLLPKETHHHISVLDRELTFESQLLTVITGETVSSLIADYLCREIPSLKKNNRSTYPDLYFGHFDYRLLPRRSSGPASGPALKGSSPSSVPDGIEIKSQRGKRIRVDCHHNHQGLHLVMTFEQVQEVWVVFDLYVAYLTRTDYRRATRNTTANTEKFSFSQTPFISVITGITAATETV